MTRYLISFDDGSMDHIPDQDWPIVGAESRAVVRDAQAAGVWVFGGGIDRQRATIARTDGSVDDGPFPETKAVVGGFCVLDVRTRDEATAWALRLAAGCRCDQEIREVLDDPEA